MQEKTMKITGDGSEMAAAAAEEETDVEAEVAVKTKKVSVREMIERVDSSEVPQVFICPISLEPMQDPVTLCTGQTYERNNILRWFSTGHYTCPTTMQELWDVSLTPNTTLRRLIAKWYSHRFFLHRLQAEDLRSRVRELVEALGKKSKGQSRLQTLVALGALTQAEECARRATVEEGGVAVLSSLLGPFTSHAVGSESIGILVRLPLDSHAKRTLAQPAKISFMVDLLHEGLTHTKINSARLIETIVTAIEEPEEELKFESVSSFRLLFGLLRLIKDRLHPRAMAAGLSLLRVICCSCNRVRNLVVRIGTVVQLVELLPFATAACVESGLAVLETLSTTPEGRKALKDCTFTIPNIVGVLMRVSDSCTQHALAILLAVCSVAPEESAPMAVQAGLAAKLLLVIQSACDPVVKQRSSELLKLCSHNYTATIFVAHTIQ